MSKITPDDIRTQYRAGESREQIAATLGVHPNKLNWAIRELKLEDDHAEVSEDETEESTTETAEPEASAQAAGPVTMGEYILRARPNLKFALDDDDDRPLIRTKCDSWVGRQLCALVDAGESLHIIRRQFRQLRNVERLKGQAQNGLLTH